MRLLLSVVLLVGLADAGDSLNCKLVGTFANRGTSAYAIWTVVNNLCYMSAGDSGLQILNVADPENPTLAGGIAFAGNVNAVCVSDSLAYLTGGNYLRVVNISDSSAPTQVGICALTGPGYGSVKSGNYVYVTNWLDEMNVVDVSDPTNPAVVGQCSTYGALSITKIGNYCYVAGAASTPNGGDLYVIDVSTPATPTEVAHMELYCTEGIDSLDATHVFLSDGNQVRIIDVSTPASPTEVGNFDISGYNYGCNVSGGYAYVGGTEGLRVLDVSDPNDDPTEVGYYASQTPSLVTGATRAGDYVYVTQQDSGIQIIEFSSVAYSDTFYVAKTGYDSSAGTPARPFATIQHGIDAAYAGDLVIVGAGKYHEQVTFPRSGTADSAIVIRGEDTLTVIDNTDSIGATWTAAPERGPGIYKKGNFDPDEMLWNDCHIIKINDNSMQGIPVEDVDTGFATLNYPTDKIWYPLGYVPTCSTAFWDDVEAIFGVLSDTTYIRFRDTLQNPDTCDLWASEGSPVGFGLDGNDYITIEHLKVKGNMTAFRLDSSDHNIIQHCDVRHGYNRVYLGTGSADNIIEHNDFTWGYGDYGQFGCGGADTGIFARRQAMYVLGKMMEGVSTSLDWGVLLNGCGENNVVDSNDMTKGQIAVYLWSAPKTRIFGNTISEFSSVGFLVNLIVESLYVYDNDIDHCNITIRFGEMDAEGDSLRSGYIYNNRAYNDVGSGAEFFRFHGGGDDYRKPIHFWVYHNSFSGGNTWAMPHPGCCSMRVVNNIWSGNYMNAATTSSDTIPALFAGFDYNFCGGLYADYRYIAWMFRDRNNQWSTDTMDGDINHQVWPIATEPNWVVPVGSTAWQAGIDLSDSFTLRGIKYGPLPGMTPGYFIGDAPNLGALGVGDTTPPPATTYGSVNAISTPAGASVWFDGVDTDSVTPCVTDSVETGSLIVKFTLAGYADYSDTVTVTGGDTVTVNKVLQSSTPSVITIQGDPRMWW